MAAIFGTSVETENAKRRVNIVGLLRYWRRRLLGEILRMHPDDMRRGEVIKHAELVRKGRVPRVGSFVMDAPAYSSVQHLKTLAGYVPPGAIETLTIARSAELERNRESWIEADCALKPD